MQEIVHHIFGEDLKAAMLIILNLILIESLLSIDNAAVLATMVMDLPREKRAKALRIGIVFAYVFRGLCLFFASYLIRITWLKLAGALYLLYLCFNFLAKKSHAGEEHIDKNKNKLFLLLYPYLGVFWSTVIMVEMMDLIFSIDNVFAAVVYAKDNIYLIWIGVFIGIITMRLVAALFVKLIERFPLLNTAAFVVIGLLGIKLLISFTCSALELSAFCEIVENKKADFLFSIFTLLVFAFPLLMGLIKKRRSQRY